MLLASSFTSAQVVFMLGSRRGAICFSGNQPGSPRTPRASLTLNSLIALLKDTQRIGQGILSGEERTEGGRGFLTPGRL